jgi:hypothetical protein
MSKEKKKMGKAVLSSFGVTSHRGRVRSCRGHDHSFRLKERSLKIKGVPPKL